MAEPFLGQLQAFGFDFPPRGWAFCNGQLLPIAQNTALFALLGTFYGGDGRSNFALPDLRGRVPIHFGSDANGNSYALGQTGGVENVTLTLVELPAHSHSFSGTSAPANVKRPVANAAYAQSTLAGPISPGNSFYAASESLVAINPNTVAVAGGGQPHDNLQPYLVLNWCIALQGIFPPRG